jgi:hypothetical protein
MRVLKKLTPGVVVALTFGGCLLALVLFVQFVAPKIETPEEACRSACERISKVGKYVPVTPEVRTLGMRGKGPMKCECF